MIHYDLCKLTAEWQIKKNADVVLFEFVKMGCKEMPDCLVYKKNYTILFEIKMSKQDFLNDQKKECREEYKTKYYPGWKTVNGKKRPMWLKYMNRNRYNQYPHLGSKRYYVCPEGIIEINDIKNNNENWGLYWIKNNRFYLKKESSTFKRNIYLELELITNALRKYANGKIENILVKQ